MSRDGEGEYNDPNQREPPSEPQGQAGIVVPDDQGGRDRHRAD
jgi:hypothetical protein